MPNGEANKTGNVLDILHANRHSSGHYKCTADNRVGQPDTREVFVNVLCRYSKHQLKIIYKQLCKNYISQYESNELFLHQTNSLNMLSLVFDKR